MIAGVAVAAVLLTALVALIALVARRFTHAKRPLGASDVREFFQYVLLYGLYVIVGIGATELLGRVFGASADSWDTSDSALAQALAFVVIGTPLLVVALWLTSRLQRSRPDQQRSSLYAVYLTVTALTALLVAASAVSPTLTFLLGGALGNNVAADGGSLATVVVWGAIWLVNWLIAERTLTVTQNTPHLLSGSLIAVLYLVGGFITTVGDSASTLWTGAVVYGTPTAIAGGVGTLLAGVLIWVRYWISRAQKLERGPLWMIFTLPLGVGGGSSSGSSGIQGPPLPLTTLPQRVARGAPPSPAVLSGGTSAPLWARRFHCLRTRVGSTSTSWRDLGWVLSRLASQRWFLPRSRR